MIISLIWVFLGDSNFLNCKFCFKLELFEKAWILLLLLINHRLSVLDSQ